LIASLLALTALPLALAQDPAPAPAPAAPVAAAAPADSGNPEAVRVFLQCPFCDFDYLRTEVTFVNYVRDRQVADVIVFVTSLPTGGGGRAFTVAFLGRGRYAGRTDTLTYTVGALDTDVERRIVFVRTVRLGLVRFAAGSPLARDIEVRYAPPGAAAPQRQGRDPWNYWVFQANASGFLSGQTATADQNIFTSISANRTTDNWKINLSANASSSRSRFDLDSVTTYVATRESYGTNAQVVRSIGKKWSTGVLAGAFYSTFTNIALRARFTPALEYDVFPYSLAQQRSLTFRYSLGVEYSSYIDTTLYGKTQETLPVHSLSLTYYVRETWGNVGLTVAHSQYLHDLSKLNENINFNTNLRLFRGLSLNLFASYTMVRDQLYLPAAGATPDEIISRQRALATDFRYFASIGFSYRVGSIYNNIVNPRFPNAGDALFNN
jgi:hypothetical protein